MVEEIFACRIEVFEVVDACYRFLGSQGVGNHAGCHVAAFIGRNAYEEVGMLHSGILHGVDAGSASLQRHDIIAAVEIAQSGGVFVNQHTVLVVA